MRLDELAKRIEAELIGDPAIEVTGVATLEDARPGEVSFLANPKYVKQLENTRASAVVCAPRVQSDRVAMLKTPEPYYAFRQAVVALHGYRKHSHEGIHPRAFVDPAATIGSGTVIYPGAYVGPGAKVGRDCIVYANASIYDHCTVGDRAIIHAGACIGSDGFGFATVQGTHHKIPQVGDVVIEDDVEIGANAVIARAALGSTIIGRGTKVDALVVIGHGCRIGPDCLLVAQVGIAGSTVLGKNVTLAGQAGLAGHIKIGDGVTVAAKGGVMSDIEEGQIMIGSPAMPASRARRVYTLFQQLPEIVDRLKGLEQQIDDLADSGDTPIA